MSATSMQQIEGKPLKNKVLTGVHIRRPWFKSKRGLQGLLFVVTIPFLPARSPASPFGWGGGWREGFSPPSAITSAAQG